MQICKLLVQLFAFHRIPTPAHADDFALSFPTTQGEFSVLKSFNFFPLFIERIRPGVSPQSRINSDVFFIVRHTLAFTPSGNDANLQLFAFHRIPTPAHADDFALSFPTTQGEFSVLKSFKFFLYL